MNAIDKIEKEVIKRCKSRNNKYGIGAWSHHIKSVVDNAVMLAKQYNADLEIVTLAALLHDIASVTNEEYYEEHNVIGAEIAEELLKKINYPDKKIQHIKKCILNHRGSRIADKLTIEEICIADADAMSHFDNIPSLFSMVYRERHMSIEEGAKFVKDKLERSYKKLSKNSKDFYRDKYERAMSIFE
jgi:uncharacterized protein